MKTVINTWAYYTELKKHAVYCIISGRKALKIIIKLKMSKFCHCGRKWMQELTFHKERVTDVKVKTPFLAAQQRKNSCWFHQDFQVESNLISHFKNASQVKIKKPNCILSYSPKQRLWVATVLLQTQVLTSPGPCGEVPPCLDGECLDCGGIDFGRNTARLSPWIHSQQQHGGKRLHQWGRISYGVCVTACVCVPTLPPETITLIQTSLEDKLSDCLIDLAAKYLVLNENCSHPAEDYGLVHCGTQLHPKFEAFNGADRNE